MIKHWLIEVRHNTASVSRKLGSQRARHDSGTSRRLEDGYWQSSFIFGIEPAKPLFVADITLLLAATLSPSLFRSHRPLIKNWLP